MPHPRRQVSCHWPWALQTSEAKGAGSMRESHLDVQEMARLQGIGDSEWALWKMAEVPCREMRDFIGNACYPQFCLDFLVLCTVGL